MSKQIPAARVESAEELHKRAITLIWYELVEIAGELKSKDTRKYGSVAKATNRFIDTFFKYYFATWFYVDGEEKKKAESLFAGADKRTVTVDEIISTAMDYGHALYKKGLMFLKEEITLEEGFDEEEGS